MYGTDRPKVVRVEIEFEDGEVRRASGEAADDLWGRYTHAMDYYTDMRRTPYDGPVMEVVSGIAPAPEGGEAPKSLAELAAAARDRYRHE